MVGEDFTKKRLGLGRILGLGLICREKARARKDFWVGKALTRKRPRLGRISGWGRLGLGMIFGVARILQRKCLG